MRRVKAISHEDELSLVEHLDELRARVVVSHRRLRRRPRPLLLAEPPAAGTGERAAALRHDKLITFGVTEPFTTTLTVAAYGGDHPRAADHPLPALRLPAAGFQQAAAAGDPAAAAADPGPLHRRHRLRLLRRPAGRDQVPAQLQRRPVQHPGAGQGVLRLLRHDPARLRHRLPGPGRDPRGHPPGIVKVEQLTKNRRYAYLAARSSRRRCPASTRSRCCWRRRR